MTLDDLIQSTGEWLRGQGPESDVVISSRVRLARNLADYPFLATASETQRTEICRSIADATASSPALSDAMFIQLDDVDALDRRLLVERQLISRQHAKGQGSRGVSVSPSEMLSVMINEEDHIRMQALRAGFQLETVWRGVSELDDALAGQLSFAFDKQFGYLTACPTNVGTGIRVSVMLHLPALRMTKEIERVARAARDMRLAVRGLYGEGTDALGDFYQLSNQITLGQSESEIVDAFSAGIVPKIIEYEHTARDSLKERRSHQLDDKIWRAYGVLQNARCLGSEETLVLLSPIRLGIELDRFAAFGVDTLNELFLFTQPAHLQKLAGKALSAEQRSITRAEFVRERVAR